MTDSIEEILGICWSLLNALDLPLGACPPSKEKSAGSPKSKLAPDPIGQFPMEGGLCLALGLYRPGPRLGAAAGA